MSLEAMTEEIKRDLRQVMRTREPQSTTPDDQHQAVQTLQRHVRIAEQALHEPVSPDLQHAHSQLVIHVELAKGTLLQFGHTPDAAA